MPTLDYMKPELMACCGAREIRDGDVVIVGTGFPTMAGQHRQAHARAANALLMQESGVSTRSRSGRRCRWATRA